MKMDVSKVKMWPGERTRISSIMMKSASTSEMGTSTREREVEAGHQGDEEDRLAMTMWPASMFAKSGS